MHQSNVSVGDVCDEVFFLESCGQIPRQADAELSRSARLAVGRRA